MGSRLDLSGHVYGRLTVLRPQGMAGTQSLWECRCECGRTIVTRLGSLRSGNTKSCGCLNLDRTRERSTKHGAAARNHQNRLYWCWQHMLGRCRNPRDRFYADYGGRGIKVCQEWRTYERFRDWALSNGYADGLSIDRIDNDGDYMPGNCRWADPIGQANNKRSNHFVEYRGRRMTLARLAEESGIPYHTLKARVTRLGWSVERAATTPVRRAL